MLEAALEYLAAGLTTIPIALDGTKSPATRKWRHLHEQVPTEAEVRAMFDKPSGIAVLGGKTSGNLTIIDFDRPGAFDAWRELLTGLAPGLLERLPIITTPGGHHVYLRASICTGNVKLAKSATAYVKDGKESFTISETRGQGGYVLCPPSPAEAHPTKILYAQLSGPPLTAIPFITDDEYGILISAARGFNEVAIAAKEDRKTAPKPSIPGGATMPGEDFDARASWYEVLEPHGWEAVHTIGDKTYWRRPGKKDGGISATTGHCGTKLWVFSSNASPFEAERAYNKFSAYGLLNTNGDYATAARELRAKGYGSKNNQKPMHRPSDDKWAQLNEGLEGINGKPPAAHVGMRFTRDPLDGSAPTQHRVTPDGVVDEPPPISDDDAPPDIIMPAPKLERITAERLEAMLDDDAAAVMRPGVFERVLAMREDRAEWLLIGDVLRRKKKKSDFNAAVKKFDSDAKREKHKDGWRSQLLYRENKDGEMVMENCLSNLVSVLTNDDAWRGCLAFDDFSNQIITRTPPPFVRRSRQWADEDALEIKSWVEQNYPLRPNFAITCEAILVVSKRATFNSLRDYVDSLEDSGGESAIDTWLIDCFGAPDTKYVREVGRNWLISAVARAYEPGCKVDTVLILEGKQGLKKSRALKQLCPVPAWFTDGLSELGSKAQAEEIEGKWIVELGELKGIGKDLDQTKAFVTREAENYRPAYGRYSVHRPRSCVFAGTVNPGNAGYLRDETGNRRWWPVACSKQSPEITPALRDKLWAEARTLYQAGVHWWIEDEEILAEAAEEQEARAHQDPWQELIEGHVLGKEEVSTDDVLGDCLRIEKAKWDNAQAQRIGRIMMQLKWIRFRKRDHAGKNRWRYRNPNYVEGPPHPAGNGHAQAAMPWA